MKPEKVIQVIDVYRQKFKEMRVDKIDYPHSEILDTFSHGLEHCHGMLDKMEEFIKEGRMDKVYRWLGFIQGVLWASRIYMMDDLKNHNRKDPE